MDGVESKIMLATIMITIIALSLSAILMIAVTTSAVAVQASKIPVESYRNGYQIGYIDGISVTFNISQLQSPPHSSTYTHGYVDGYQKGCTSIMRQDIVGQPNCTSVITSWNMTGLPDEVVNQ
jgi:hypothetical protein